MAKKPLKPANLPELIKDIKAKGMDAWLLEQLAIAYGEARRGKLHTTDEHLFEVCWIENLINLRDAVICRAYEPGASVAFVVYDPMVREIFAAPFKDRVIHHFLYNMQAGWWDRRFIYDSYSCRNGKGTLFAAKRAQTHMRKVTESGQVKARVFKGDFKGYFMSLSRDKLFKRVEWGLLEQFKDVMDDPYGRELFRICRFLWEKVLYDDPVEKGWRRGDIKQWEPSNLPPEKSLFTQPEGYGIVIGNLTSQLVSNIYLDQFDRHVVFDLGYKHYGRYVDDFFIMVPEEDWPRLKMDIPKLEAYAMEDLELTVHPKKRYVQSVQKGMTFCGTKIYPWRLCPSHRIQGKLKKALKALTEDQSGALDSVVSYLGMLKNLDAEEYTKKTLESFGLS